MWDAERNADFSQSPGGLLFPSRKKLEPCEALLEVGAVVVGRRRGVSGLRGRRGGPVEDIGRWEIEISLRLDMLVGRRITGAGSSSPWLWTSGFWDRHSSAIRSGNVIRERLETPLLGGPTG